jgi:hypothetical protein
MEIRHNAEDMERIAREMRELMGTDAEPEAGELEHIAKYAFGVADETERKAQLRQWRKDEKR